MRTFLLSLLSVSIISFPVLSAAQMWQPSDLLKKMQTGEPQRVGLQLNIDLNDEMRLNIRANGVTQGTTPKDTIARLRTIVRIKGEDYAGDVNVAALINIVVIDEYVYFRLSRVLGHVEGVDIMDDAEFKEIWREIGNKWFSVPLDPAYYESLGIVDGQYTFNPTDQEAMADLTNDVLGAMFTMSSAENGQDRVYTLVLKENFLEAAIAEFDRQLDLDPDLYDTLGLTTGEQQELNGLLSVDTADLQAIQQFVKQHFAVRFSAITSIIDDAFKSSTFSINGDYDGVKIVFIERVNALQSLPSISAPARSTDLMEYLGSGGF